MNTIKKLPDSVTNKIAAGEVVERPSAVIKELMENSVDAGSTKIDVYIQDGGKEKIQIIDDGCGMSREDTLLSLERFSTSKIDRFEDLDSLYTFGFRGEALASVASVSLLEIKTKTEEDAEGIRVRCEGGVVVDNSVIPWNGGTSITVGKIFFNTPARRKFQKNRTSEIRQIYRVFRYFALTYPEIQLSLYNDDRCVWNLQSSDLSKRIADVFEPSIREKLVEISYSNEFYTVYGFVSRPDFTRSTRNDQYLFVNRRYIKNRTIEHGVYHGYGTTLSHGSGHPFFVFMLSLSPDLFDINIHPAKLEARFQDDRGLHRFFSKAVSKGIGLPEMQEFSRISGKSTQSVATGGSFPAVLHTSESSAQGEALSLDLDAHSSADPAHAATDTSQGSEIESRKIDRDKVWQVHNCYIFSQVKSGLIVIDQHVAHERILYEKALSRLHGGEKPSQQLLFPQTLQVRRDEIVILTELISELNKIGFEIKIFGDDTVVIESAPLEIKSGREAETIRALIEEYQKDEYKDLALHDRLAMSYACRSAIMKGDKLTIEEMYKLIDDLFATENPFFCPHGRPTVIDMTLQDLNSRFLR